MIWLALEPARISKRARAAIHETRQHGEALAISDITLLEIATIENKGRIKLNASLEAFLAEIEPDSLFCRSQAESVLARWHFQQPILRIQPTESLERPH